MPPVQFSQWQEEAAEQQQTFFERFGDRQWDLIDEENEVERNALLTKLSFTLFALPYADCDVEKKRTVNLTKNKILELSGSGGFVNFDSVFISVLPKDLSEPSIVPLIRTRQTYGDKEFYVETQPGRVYEGWTDFRENNKLPECWMCFPAIGYYYAEHQNRVDIRFEQSPSCSKLFPILDVVSFVGKIASGGLLAATVFFPVMTPVTVGAISVLGATSTYSVTRSITQLVDRGTHHQSVGLDDAEARGLWIGMGTDIIGTALSGSAFVLPRLVASGRLAGNIAVGIADILNWASIGVNSFGALADLVVLVLRFVSGTLETRDITSFIESCVYICNISLNYIVANQVIRWLSDRPSQLGSNVFRMIANTSLNAVKRIIGSIDLEPAIQIICGPTIITCFRYLNMNHTANFLRSVGNILRQLNRGRSSVTALCVDVAKLLNSHLRQVLAEVMEALKTIRSYVIMVNDRLLFQEPQIEAPQVLRSVDVVLENAEIRNQQDMLRFQSDLLHLATLLAERTNVRTEQNFASTCRRLMNHVATQFTRKVIVARSSNGLTSVSSQTILRDIIRDFREKLRNHSAPIEVESDLANETEMHTSLLPISQDEGFELFAFQALYSIQIFDQFVHDTACRLLQDDLFMEHCQFDVSDERVIVIQSGGKTLIYYYEQPRLVNYAIGFVLLKA